MSHVTDREIERVQRETGMQRMQAYRHVKATHYLQELARRERKEAVDRCVRSYAALTQQGATPC